MKVREFRSRQEIRCFAIDSFANGIMTPCCIRGSYDSLQCFHQRFGCADTDLVFPFFHALIITPHNCIGNRSRASSWSTSQPATDSLQQPATAYCDRWEGCCWPPVYQSATPVVFSDRWSSSVVALATILISYFLSTSNSPSLVAQGLKPPWLFTHAVASLQAPR